MTGKYQVHDEAWLAEGKNCQAENQSKQVQCSNLVLYVEEMTQNKVQPMRSRQSSCKALPCIHAVSSCCPWLSPSASIEGPHLYQSFARFALVLKKSTCPHPITEQHQKAGSKRQNPPEKAPNRQRLCLVDAQPESISTVLHQHLIGILSETSFSYDVLRKFLFPLQGFRLRKLPLHPVAPFPAWTHVQQIHLATTEKRETVSVWLQT